MTNAVIECILSRRSSKFYDPAAILSDDQIRELVRIGTTAPTSFNLQNWRFIARRTPEAEARLSPIAWNQPAITEAAVTFIVIGKLADASTLPQRLAPAVEAGIMPAHMGRRANAGHAVFMTINRSASVTKPCGPQPLAQRR